MGNLLRLNADFGYFHRCFSEVLFILYAHFFTWFMLIYAVPAAHLHSPHSSATSDIEAVHRYLEADHLQLIALTLARASTRAR